MRQTLLGFLFVLFTPWLALAQPVAQPAPPVNNGAAQPAPNNGQVAQPAPAGQVAQPAPQETPPVQEAEQGRGIEYGAHLLVPIWVAGQEGLGVGIGGQVRVGWEFGGGLTAELNAGIMYVSADNPTGLGLDGVSDLWVGAGLRYSFLNPSALVPFVGAGLQLNIWNGCQDDGYGSTDCGGDSQLGIGFNALGGIIYEIDVDIALEAGLQANVVLEGSDFPTETSVYLTPFVGGTLYYD